MHTGICILDVATNYPQHGLHEDSWDKYTKNDSSQTFQVCDIANTIFEYKKPNNMKAAAEKFGVSMMARQRSNAGKNPAPSTFEDICIFVTKLAPTGKRDGCF